MSPPLDDSPPPDLALFMLEGASCETGARDLVDRYLARLTALASSRLSSSLRRRLDPEDIVLSAFRSFFVAAREGRFDATTDGDLWSLLATITLRKLAHQARRHRSEKRSVLRESEPPEDWTAPAREVPTAEEAALLADELEWLIEATEGLDREILIRQLRGEPGVEIARELGVSDRTVRRSQQRTRELVTADRSHGELAQRTARGEIERTPMSVTLGPGGPGYGPTRSLDELKLHEMVGQGAFSKVFRATDRKLGRTVAVKFLKKASWSDARAIASFLREFEILNRLQHPHLLPVYGWGRTSRSAVFLVMEWIEGQSLEPWQHERRPISEVLKVGCEVASGLIAAHAAGVWHCDLKPGNVLLDVNGHARLADFGLARWGSDDDSPRGGTAGFLAPEQINLGFGAISERTDVYGLGGLLYALLAGRPPCEGSDLPETIVQVLSQEPVVDLQVYGIPETVSRVVMRALCKRSEERWPDVATLATELERVCRTTGEQP